MGDPFSILSFLDNLVAARAAEDYPFPLDDDTPHLSSADEDRFVEEQDIPIPYDDLDTDEG